ncbi:MAG TPA: cytidylate kinase-like family protein [Candidatus Angelobacter sp.]|nr:cytidylate kinase-like family protein [Candidatus Angelobacter sp.]
MINIEDFIRKRLALYRAYEIRDNRERPGRGKEGKLSYGPYLLISREKGAGGSAVGKLAGKRLGWQVFDNEIVDAIAQKANVRRELIESLDERERAMIQEIVQRWLNPKSIGKSGYLAHLREILLTLGHQGDVVIVGRGAQYALPSEFGLRVRMVAPVEVRVRRIAKRENMSLDRARKAIKKSDRERTRLAFKEYRRILTDPLNYDVTINSAEMTVEDATEVVLNALQRKLAVKLKRRGSA